MSKIPLPTEKKYQKSLGLLSACDIFGRLRQWRWGGNPGTYSGNPQYCADAAGTGGGTPNPEAGGGSVVGLFTKSGTGDTVFDLPTRVTRIHIEGTFTGRSSSFIVRIGGNSTVVSDILGTAIQRTGFAGTYFIAGGGAVEITRSTGALWTFTEIP